MRTTVGIVLVGVALAGVGCSASSTPSSSTPSSAGAPTAGPSRGAAASPGASATTNPGTPSPGGPSSAVPFVVRSKVFEDGGAIPRRFTCDGADVSPDLEWSGVPAGSRSLVLLVRDPDASDFVHWVAYDIPAEADGLSAAASGSAAAPPEGRNDFGKRGWGGPCPPSGTHRYVFSLSALDRPLGLTGTPRAAQVAAAMSGHVLGEAHLTGRYKRG